MNSLYSSLKIFTVLILCYYLDGFSSNLSTLFYVLTCTALSSQLALLFWVSLLIPYVIANPQSAPFPDIDFKDFSDFIISNFGQKISLPTVIMVLLSMTHNTELLSLHFKQDKAGSRATLWIKCLSHAILEQLGSDNADTLFLESELSMFETTTAKHRDVASLSMKLSELSQLFNTFYSSTDSTRIWEFRQIPQELTGILEFCQNPLESIGIHQNLQELTFNSLLDLI
jgi:hypothetical protein